MPERGPGRGLLWALGIAPACGGADPAAAPAFPVAAGNPRPSRDQRAAGRQLPAVDADRGMVACPCGHHGCGRVWLGARLQGTRLAGAAIHAGGSLDGGIARLPVELPAVPHEGLLLPDRLVRRGRDHPAAVEVERAHLAVRRAERHQAHSAFAQHRRCSRSISTTRSTTTISASSWWRYRWSFSTESSARASD